MYRAIQNQLLSSGFGGAQIHIMREYCDRLSISYLEENLSKYEEAYRLLEDDFSEKVFLVILRKTYLMADISEIVRPCAEEYFDEKVILTEKEVFVDCGGFDGDTSVKSIEKCGGVYADIVIFEPELYKKTDIEKNMSGHHYELYQAGV